MLNRRETVDSRLEAHRDIGTYERPEVSLSESAASRLALEGIQAAYAHRQEVAKNSALIDNFIDVLVPNPARGYHDRIDVPVGDLDRVKQLQSSLVWSKAGTPRFIVGSRQTKNPNISSLLLAQYPFSWMQHRDLQRIHVNTKDLEVAESFMTALPQQEYSPEDIHLLTDEESGSFKLTGKHPRSVKLKTYEYSNIPFLFTLSRKTLAPKLKRGIRSKSRAAFSMDSFPIPELTDQTFEDYGVLDRFADLAVIFGKENELRYLIDGKPARERTRSSPLARSVRWLVGR